MKSGAFVFLAAFLALAASWSGFVMAPQIQLGGSLQTNALVTSQRYPLDRPGLARQGLDVYRANGCVHCHSQQVRQDGTVCQIVLVEAGTNAAATAAAIAKFSPDAAGKDAVVLLAGLPKVMMTVADVAVAQPILKALMEAGAKAEANIVGVGPDIDRGWGRRRTVAQDYLFDYPVQLGSRRIGPDLANVGARRDANWHLRHLYAPRSEVKGSIMPPYRNLFETRKVGAKPSPDALQFSSEVVPAGYEVIPTPDAQALAAYLMSLRADVPLFEGPMSPAPGSTPPPTNAPVAVSSAK